MKVCKIEGCGKKVDSNGLCKTHASRLRRTGDPLGVRKIASRGTDTCTIPGCDNPHDSYGLCRTHRTRQINHGDPLIVTKPDPEYRSRKCSVDGCESLVGDGSNGMCRSHFRKSRYDLRGDHFRAKNNQRRSERDQATLSGTESEVYEFYKQCPSGADVDHIIPLKAWSDVVCGLNSPANLRYRPISENRAAGSAPCPPDVQTWLEEELAKPAPVIAATERVYVRTAPPVPERLCSVEGCTAKHYGSGLCRSHYGKQRRESGVDHDKA